MKEMADAEREAHLVISVTAVKEKTVHDVRI
jgi:hypothetical protein